MIKKEWDRYKKSVYNNKLHEIQETECRRAFMGGAFVALEILLACTNTDKDVNETFEELYSDISEAISQEIREAIKKS